MLHIIYVCTYLNYINVKTHVKNTSYSSTHFAYPKRKVESA